MDLVPVSAVARVARIERERNPGPTNV